MADRPSTPARKLALRSDADAEELLIGAGPEADAPADDASAGSDETLTLLDELSQRRVKATKRNLALNLGCAIASLTFAFLAYQKL